MSRYILNQSFARYEIVDTTKFYCHGENWLSFSTQKEAESFLASFLNKFENRMTLQQFLTSTLGTEFSGNSMDANIQRTAEFLVSGRFRIRKYNEIDSGWETSFGYPLGVWNEMKPVTEIQSQANDAQEEIEEETDWIEIQMVDENDQAIIGEKFQLIQNAQVVFRGRTGSRGACRVNMLIAGDYEITFPDLDEQAWGKN